MTSYLRWYFVRCSWNSLAKITSYFSVPVCIWICESNMIDPGSWTLYINPLINRIENIYHFFPMTRCTYASINYDGVTLTHYWHKVQCRGTSCSAQAPWCLGCGTQKGNSENWFVLQYIFTALCATSSLFWTWYCLSVHFLSMNSFLILLDQWYHICGDILSDALGIP